MASHATGGGALTPIRWRLPFTAAGEGRGQRCGSKSAKPFREEMSDRKWFISMSKAFFSFVFRSSDSLLFEVDRSIRGKFILHRGDTSLL